MLVLQEGSESELHWNGQKEKFYDKKKRKNVCCQCNFALWKACTTQDYRVLSLTVSSFSIHEKGVHLHIAMDRNALTFIAFSWIFRNALKKEISWIETQQTLLISSNGKEGLSCPYGLHLEHQISKKEYYLPLLKIHINTFWTSCSFAISLK